MRKKIVFVTITLFILSSCKKYPDGPSISLISKTERLSNSWKIAQALENDLDKTSDYQFAFTDYNLIIEEDGDYSFSYKALGILPVSETGKWSFNDDKTKVIFDPSSNNNTNNEWKILKLMEEEVWLIDEENNGNTLELHLIPN